MPLAIERLELASFRNYAYFELDHIGPLTIFVGPNAIGKTNLIESVQLVTACTSFRHPRVEHLVREGDALASVQARLTDGDRLLDVRMTAEPGKKRYFLNGKAKRPADLRGTLPSVTFTPDDLNLIKGGMSHRRGALDDLGAQLSANHQVIRRDYENVIRHKNALLKDDASDDLIWSINQMVVTVGAQLSCYRAALFAKLARHLKQAYAEISQSSEELECAYVPSWSALEGAAVPVGEQAAFTRDQARECMESCLTTFAGQERARRRSLVGPHVDRIEFYLQGRDASVFGSQGQQRSIVLAWKLAEVRLIDEVLGQRPVLLLDDVMSELDASRRNQLVGFMEDSVQVFITTTTPEYFTSEVLDRARVVKLGNNGGVSRETFR
ncbi:MAG: DNA replication and repair protein RecF [Coriobacteriia bacterium]|nr:DNA replication and repair protein RecF [Coriobacteriia bacterium]